jgi:Domain of unknown function (DUF4281)
MAKETMSRFLVSAYVGFVLMSGVVSSFQVSPKNEFRTRSERMMLPEAFDIVSAASHYGAVAAPSSSLVISTTSVSPEPIHAAFSVATFLPQPFWLLMILLPNNAITKKIMGGLGWLVPV